MSVNEEEKEMSFLGHLEELRWRLVRSSSVIIVAAITIFYFTDPIVNHVYLAMSKTDFLTYRFFCWLSNSFGLSDILCANDIPIQIQSIEMTKQFSTNMYFALIGGLVISFPFTFYQLWTFVKPGLKSQEIKITKGVVLNASLLFFTGIFFGYYMISPLCVQFFGGYKLTDEIQNNFTISSYMSMITTSTFLSGLFFELPIVMYILAKIGILGPDILKKYRKHSLVAILILSALITPPDVVSQLLVSFPIYALYEFGIIIVKRVEKKRKKDLENEQNTNTD
jgi:sec-independent protein translocase protein TatC